MIVKYSYMDNLLGISYSWTFHCEGSKLEQSILIMSVVVLGRGHGVNVRNRDRIKEVRNMMSGDKA